MLDELLGRAALKERVAELEEEAERLRAQLDAERERRAEAVRDRQAADERVNRLEDRIADLEGRLDRAGDGERTLDFRDTARLRGDRLAEVLGRLEGFRTGPEGAFTAMVEGRSDAVREAFGERAALVGRAAPCLALADDAGIVSLVLDPPLAPDPFAGWGDRFRLDRGWFLPEGEFALALVRSDLFACGEYDGPERTGFEGFSSDVKGDHSKGGFSQARFSRRRDGQIDAHLDRSRAAVEALDADRVVVVGERTLLGEFDDLAVATAAVDATGDPEPALDDAFREFFTTSLYLP